MSLPGRLGQQVAAGADWFVDVFLGPQIQQRGGIRDVARPVGTGTLGADDAFNFEACQHAVSQAARDGGLFREVFDPPCPLGI